jgi:hypothetical protein
MTNGVTTMTINRMMMMMLLDEMKMKMMIQISSFSFLSQVDEFFLQVRVHILLPYHQMFYSMLLLHVFLLLYLLNHELNGQLYA